MLDMPTRFQSAPAAAMFRSAVINHCRLGRPVRMRRGAYLYRHGDVVGDRLYLVRFGAFKTCGHHPRGGTHITSFQFQHDMLALDSVGLARHCSDAVALVESEVIRVGYQQLSELEVDIWQILSDELARAQDWSQVKRGSTSIVQRMAVFLLSCASRYSALGYSSRCFRLPMPRCDLANFLGMSGESVSRAMEFLRNAKFVQTNGRCITLLNVSCLRELAGGSRAALDFAAGGTCIPVESFGSIMSVVGTDLRSRERKLTATLCIERPAGMCCTPGNCDAPLRRSLEPVSARCHTVIAGQHLYRMEQPVSNKVYAIHSGQFKVYQLSPQGRQYVACFSSVGDLLGMDAVSRERYRCSAEALCDSVLVEFSLSDLRVAQTRPAARMPDLARMLSKGIATEAFLTIQMADSDATQRLAEYILTLAKGLPAEASWNLPLRMTREDIADHLGLAPETVSRILCGMERKGYIRTTRNMICVIAVCRLRAVAGHVQALPPIGL